MQPQEGGGFEWWHAISGMGGGVLGTFLTWFWRVSRAEPKLQASFEASIVAAERRVEDVVKEGQNAFDETLKGLRQKINDVELSSERRFVSKDDFNEFREEYREDMRDLKDMISNTKARTQ